MAKCARCQNDAVTRVRYQTHPKSLDVCATHHDQFVTAAQAAGLRLMYDNGLDTGAVADSGEVLSLLQRISGRLDALERGEPPLAPPRLAKLRTPEEIRAELNEALTRLQSATTEPAEDSP